jgi:hypothetical protein
MSRGENHEPVDEDVDSVAIVSTASIPASPYSKISREIAEADLSSPAVQRILLGEVDKLQQRVEHLEEIEAKFYRVDKERAILQEKVTSLTSHDVLYGFCLTIGSAIVGLSPLVWEHGYGEVTIGTGLILVLGAILSRVIKWR